MLVIGRRPGESITLGDDIQIEILEASASQVKLGIRAPRSVVVLRTEIREIGEQNRAAARNVSSTDIEKVIRTLNKPVS